MRRKRAALSSKAAIAAEEQRTIRSLGRAHAARGIGMVAAAGAAVVGVAWAIAGETTNFFAGVSLNLIVSLSATATGLSFLGKYLWDRRQKLTLRARVTELEEDNTMLRDEIAQLREDRAELKGKLSSAQEKRRSG